MFIEAVICDLRFREKLFEFYTEKKDNNKTKNYIFNK